MIDLAKEELKAKNESVALIRESVRQTNDAIKAMTDAMNNVGNGVKEGLALIAQSFMQSTQMSYPMFGMMSPQASFQTPKQSSDK